LLYSFAKLFILRHSDIHPIFPPFYHAGLVNFQAEVVTLAEQACEDIAGPFATMVSVLNINNNFITSEPTVDGED